MGWLKDLANNNSGSGGLTPNKQIFGNDLLRGGGANFEAKDPLRGSAERNPWIMNSLPQYTANDPYRFKIGKEKIDMRDPRVAAGIIAPGVGTPLMTYGIGKQIENNRQDRRLEREYKPAATANANVAAQNAAYGGTEGGSGNAQADQAYQQIMTLLMQEKRKVRQRQAAQEEAALGVLMQLIGSSAGAGV